MKPSAVITSGLILTFGIGLLSVATDGFHAFTSETARRLAIVEEPRRLPASKLISQDGELLSFEQYKGRLLLVDFIYTRCPDVCHSLGYAFKKLRADLQELRLDDEVQLISISFDPDYDKEQQLNLYLQRFGQLDADSWIAVRTENDQELAVLLKTFGVEVIKNEFGGYDHNAAIHLIDQDGRLIQIYDYAAAAQVIQDIRKQLQV